MTTRYVTDWRFLAVGALASLVMTAVGTFNAQAPGTGIVLGIVNFVAYFGILWLSDVCSNAATKSGFLLASAGTVACFIVLMAVGNAVVHGRFSLLPDRPSWWAIPIGAAIWTAIQWRRRFP